MALYEIRIDWYNHISGSDTEIYEYRYTNINAAKRKLLELVLSDENLCEEDAECELDKNLMFAHCEGRRDTSDYSIHKTNVKVCSDVSSKISEDELAEKIKDVIERHEELQFKLV